ncbi:hypothetical protein IWQ60_008514 [Tieghemiomyces parasiticus]|uniref:Uncharacterized protein n=1 Tax=Tieghemiomyces parasiticus TaxID=78921 RepID=A0A9W8DR56_9FUNG|nr:hypothetical protein IWQ60_008514 [Tieghemiomyces parasiticus]
MHPVPVLSMGLLALALAAVGTVGATDTAPLRHYPDIPPNPWASSGYSTSATPSAPPVQPANQDTASPYLHHIAYQMPYGYQSAPPAPYSYGAPTPMFYTPQPPLPPVGPSFNYQRRASLPTTAPPNGMPYAGLYEATPPVSNRLNNPNDDDDGAQTAEEKRMEAQFNRMLAKHYRRQRRPKFVRQFRGLMSTVANDVTGLAHRIKPGRSRSENYGGCIDGYCQAWSTWPSDKDRDRTNGNDVAESSSTTGGAPSRSTWNQDSWISPSNPSHLSTGGSRLSRGTISQCGSGCGAPSVSKDDTPVHPTDTTGMSNIDRYRWARLMPIYPANPAKLDQLIECIVDGGLVTYLNNTPPWQRYIDYQLLMMGHPATKYLREAILILGPSVDDDHRYFSQLAAEQQRTGGVASPP